MPCDEAGSTEGKEEKGNSRSERAVELLRKAVSQIYSVMRKDMDAFFVANVDHFLPHEDYDPEEHEKKVQLRLSF